VQHRVVGMVSTTIGYRSKLQQRHQKSDSAGDSEMDEEPSSTSPGHAQSSDHSADTEYCPHVQPAAASPSSPQCDADASKSDTKHFATRGSVDLSVHAQKTFLGAGKGVTPSTIAKRRSRMPAIGGISEDMTILAPSPRPPSLDRQASDAPTVSKTTDSTKRAIVAEVRRKHAHSQRSAAVTAGVSKKVCSHAASSPLRKQHKGMVVCQRVVDACRPPLLWVSIIDASLPVANRTPVKLFNSKAAEIERPRLCPTDETGFSSNSDSEDCFSDHACVPTALLDVFSPVRPHGMPNASDSRDFELEFGWDPVVQNAVMKNAFDGFGAIRSH
jgi:hypothetical protein